MGRLPARPALVHPPEAIAPVYLHSRQQRESPFGLSLLQRGTQPFSFKLKLPALMSDNKL